MEYLYHYTSFSSLFNIVKTYRDSMDKDNIILWASHILNMNDPTEMYAGYKAIMKYLPLLENKLNIEQDKRISNLPNETQVHGLEQYEVDDLIMKGSFNSAYCPFVVSLSQTMNSIPMWYMYADKGNGVCIAIDQDVLFDSLNKKWIPILVNYEYDILDNLLSETICGLIKESYSLYFNSLNLKDDYMSLWNKKITHLKAMCTTISPFFKNEQFKFEKEMRIINYENDINNVNFRNRKGETLIPYVDFPVPVNSIKYIYLGPCVYSERNKEIMDSFIHTYMPNIEIEIIDSKIPIRNS